LPLDQQGRPLGLHPGGGGVGAGAVLGGGPILGQPGVDPPDGLLVIPRRLEPGHIVGQAGVQAAEPFILIGRHRHSPFSASAVTVSQKLTASYSQQAASVPLPTLVRWRAFRKITIWCGTPLSSRALSSAGPWQKMSISMRVASLRPNQWYTGGKSPSTSAATSML